MRLVVEDAEVGFDRLGREGIDAPRRHIQNSFHSIERQGHVGSVAIGYQTLRSIDQPLATDTKCQRSVGTERVQFQIDKELREVELILIDGRARSADPGVFPIAHQFSENPYVFSQVEIAKQKIAWQPTAARTLR